MMMHYISRTGASIVYVGFDGLEAAKARVTIQKAGHYQIAAPASY